MATTGRPAIDADRLPRDPEADGKASADAQVVLDGLATDDAHDAVCAYARHDRQRVLATWLLRTLQRAGGRLALVTWSQDGITAVGYDADAQRFERATYDGVAERMGRDPERYECVGFRAATAALRGARPDIVTRAESDLLAGEGSA